MFEDALDPVIIGWSQTLQVSSFILKQDKDQNRININQLITIHSTTLVLMLPFRAINLHTYKVMKSWRCSHRLQTSNCFPCLHHASLNSWFTGECCFMFQGVWSVWKTTLTTTRLLCWGSILAMLDATHPGATLCCESGQRKGFSCSNPYSCTVPF